MPVDAGVERAEAPQLELVLELAEAHEDEREERLRVPFVVEEDVQVPQHLRVG